MAIPDSPRTREEQYLNRAATGEGSIPDKPITRKEMYLDAIAKNGGDPLDPEAIADAVSDYLDEHGVSVTETDPTVPSWAKAQSKPSYTAAEVGAAEPATVTTVSGTTPTIAAADNTIYKCGTCSTLEITSFPATGIFAVIFESGSTATTLTVPQTLIMPDSFTVEANKRYEVSVMDGYATAQGWAVSAS